MKLVYSYVEEEPKVLNVPKPKLWKELSIHNQARYLMNVWLAVSQAEMGNDHFKGGEWPVDNYEWDVTHAGLAQWEGEEPFVIGKEEFWPPEEGIDLDKKCWVAFAQPERGDGVYFYWQ